jgi:hypothetical protein
VTLYIDPYDTWTEAYEHYNTTLRHGDWVAIYRVYSDVRRGYQYVVASVR